MSSTCQKYVTTHHNTEFIIIYPFKMLYKFVILKVAMASVLFCALYSQCPTQGTTLEVSLPPYRPSSHAPLPRSVAPSFIRSLPPSSLSLTPFLSSTLPPLPLPPSLTSSLPHSLPSSLAPSHPPSLLPCLPPCLHASRHPIQCTLYVCFGKLHCIV